jgi:carboxymethylenebutenolidase
MGKIIQLEAGDGHAFDAYRADPDGEARGGLVVMQEAFGVNEHIRAICDAYAASGYVTAAPAIYDRQQRGATFDYDEASWARAREFRARVDYGHIMLDIASAIAALRAHGRVGIVGFCVGGSAAWLAACRLNIDAVVCYYPSDIGKQYMETPHCPVIVHFAERDRLVSAADHDNFRAAHPDVPTHIYPAEHGFNNWHRPVTYDKASADLARDRTLALFATCVAHRVAR